MFALRILCYLCPHHSWFESRFLLSLAYITSGLGGRLKFDSFFKNASTFSLRIPKLMSDAHVSASRLPLLPPLLPAVPDALSPQPTEIEINVLAISLHLTTTL